MIKKCFLLFLVILFSVSAFANTKALKAENQYPNYDLAPGVIPQNVPQMDPMWDLQYEYLAEGATGDNGCLGIEFDGTYIWISGRSVTAANQIYLLNPITGAYVSQFPTGTTSAWGVRDMCHDGTYIYGGEDSGLICFDPVTQLPIMTLPWPAGMSFPRANTYDPATDHFYGGNFGTNCYEMTRQGTLVRSWSPTPLAAVYGMAWDDQAPDGPWLWVVDQTYPTSGCQFHKMDPTTLTYTLEYHTLNPPSAIGAIAGGGELVTGIDPQYSSFVSFGQGTPDCGAAWEGYIQADPLAPGVPTNFTVEPNGGDLIASLSWTNPAVQVNGDPLTDLDGVFVYRDGTMIADLTGMGIGAPATYEDISVPNPGMHNYMVKPYNTVGNGLPATSSAWIGLDCPGPPTDVVAVPDPLQLLEATVTWVAPTAGGHGGYFPPGSWDGQRIYRNGTRLLDLAGTNTQYVDNPPIQGFYTYGVSYYNAAGEGDVVDALQIYVGQAQYEPIAYDWVDISTMGTNTGIHADDIVGGPFPVGFSFPFFAGTLYNQVWVSSNGWFTFTATTGSAFSNYAIPTASAPNNIVCPFWDDLNLVSAGNIYYYYDAANTRFILQYQDVPMYSGGGTVTFQTYLYENGDVVVMWNSLTGNLISNTVGIENATGTEGIQVTYNNSGPINPANQTGVIIYSVGTPPEPLDVFVTLTPIGSTTIPATGGMLNFDVEVENAEPIIATCDIWTTATLPNGSVYGPIINVNKTFNAGQVITRNRDQVVPAGAPAGDYTYDAYTGIYPSYVWQEDHFEFTKTAVDNGGQIFYGWENYGESFEDITEANALSVESYALGNAYPNPFNPTATIAYDLVESVNVSLVIYDVTGRTVATLVDGLMPAGKHLAEFNGQGLSSGVYFYKLTAGTFTDTKKMVLMK